MGTLKNGGKKRVNLYTKGFLRFFYRPKFEAPHGSHEPSRENGPVRRRPARGSRCSHWANSGGVRVTGWRAAPPPLRGPPLLTKGVADSPPPQRDAQNGGSAAVFPKELSEGPDGQPGAVPREGAGHYWRDRGVGGGGVRRCWGSPGGGPWLAAPPPPSNYNKMSLASPQSGCGGQRTKPGAILRGSPVLASKR